MEPCPCNSGKSFADCCQPYLDGKANPPTPEALMRSRYTAYACKDAPYILATSHPVLRATLQLKDIAAWANAAAFKRLEVLETKTVGEEGFVRFIAWFKEKGRLQAIHERSRFLQEDGKWLYIDGQHLPTKMPGPNDPCPCGSGAKYKKCCGA
jgi:SEC-C motif domain protein